MSNNLFKPNRSGNEQVPAEEPATSGMNMELLEKIAELLKGIKAANDKVADNCETLKKIHDQLQNLTVPESRLDDESRELLLSAPNSITDDVEKILSEKLGKFFEDLDNILKGAECSIKKAADGGTSKVTNAVISAEGKISRFQSWCDRWLFYFIGAVIWAVLASGMAIWQCSSASSVRREVEYELDSLKLNSDVYYDFINHNVETGRSYEMWFQSNISNYRYRIHRRDSLRLRNAQ